MQAIVVIPGQPDSVHVREVPTPRVDDVPGARGVLVKVLSVGVDGTDREINAAEYGAPPSGDDYLILGHESFGRVEAVGASVTELRPGDYVAATVRRPGSSVYDRIGTYDMTTDDVYFERGINLRHGFLAEYYVDEPEYIVRVPDPLRHVGVLMEPSSVAEKAIAQAYEIQRRLKVWQPRRAAVLGTGTLGLLTALFLRLRGLDVVALGRTPPPYRNADLLAEIGARYLCTEDIGLAEASKRHGPFDIIVEGTGFSPLVFEAMEVLAKNGVLVLVGITGGDRRVEVPADRINLSFVLGNKVVVGSVNANREHFEIGARDLAQAELHHPGWLSKLLTHPVKGLDAYRDLMHILGNGRNVIKVYCEVAEAA